MEICDSDDSTRSRIDFRVVFCKKSAIGVLLCAVAHDVVIASTFCESSNVLVRAAAVDRFGECTQVLVE
jgi:hypothetical protein